MDMETKMWLAIDAFTFLVVMAIAITTWSRKRNTDPNRKLLYQMVNVFVLPWLVIQPMYILGILYSQHLYNVTLVVEHAAAIMGVLIVGWYYLSHFADEEDKEKREEVIRKLKNEQR